jgi:hypothetical protein
VKNVDSHKKCCVGLSCCQTLVDVVEHIDSARARKNGVKMNLWNKVLKMQTAFIYRMIEHNNEIL